MKKAAPPAPAGRRLQYKWELLLILWAAYFLKQGGWQIYGAVAPLIKTDLAVSDVELGMVATVFTLILAVCAPVGGVLGDFVSKKWLVCFSLITFGVGTLLTGWSMNLMALILFRGVVTGVGLGFYYPAANTLIGQYHQETRAQAMAVHQTSVYAGIVVSSWFAGWIGQQHGWRWSFYVFGAAGVLVGSVAALRLRNERRDAELPELVAAATQPMTLPEVLRPIWRTPTFYFISLAFGGAMFANLGSMMWMPTYLFEKYHLSLADAALYAVLYHFIFAFFGVIVGGRLSDRLARRRKTIRMEVEFIGLLGAVPFLWMLGSSSGLIGIYVALAGYGFFRGVYESNLFAVLFDVIPPRSRSSATGLVILWALGVGALAPVLLGYIKQHVNLAAGLSWLAAGYLLSALAIGIALKGSLARDYIPMAQAAVEPSSPGISTN